MAENIRLQYGHTTAEVQTAGAQLASLKGADGREVMWQADPAVWAQHAPVLFPVCGTAKDERVYIAGERYPMTKHGFTRSIEFEVTKQGPDFVELTLPLTEENQAMLPFRYAFRVSYQLFEGGCTTAFEVTNRDDRPMPFCVGGHPGYNVPMEDGASFSDYELVFEKTETGVNTLAPNGGCIDGTEVLTELAGGQHLPLSHDLFDSHDALIFVNPASRSVNLTHRRSGHGLKFDYPKFEVLAVWTKPGANAPYLCLEPWHGMPEQAGESGNFEEKPFVTILKPGETYRTWFTVTEI